MPTQLILTANVQGLGSEGDRVAVADGYARNYLLPQSLAMTATAAALRQIESLKLKRAERERKELEEAQELAKKISKLHSAVELQTGEQGKAFGSITNTDIASALAGRGFQIDRKAVLLDEPIKKTGLFEIPIRLHPQVTATFKLTVSSANQPAPAETTEADARTKTVKSAKPKAAK